MISLLKPPFGWRKASSQAFAATVVIAYVCSIWEGEIPVASQRGLLCLIFGAAYAIVGTIDYVYFCNRATEPVKILYLLAQGCLLLGVIWTGRLSGEIGICVFPLAAATVALLGAPLATVGVALIYAMTLAVEGHFYGTHSLIRWSMSMIPSFGFVVIFTQLALKANAARTRAEALAAEVETLAVIRERNRLAREIHDGLGHYLTTIHVQLQAAQAVHATDPRRALEAVAKAQGLARDALDEVRRSVSTLQADLSPTPLGERLRDLASATDGWGSEVSVEILGEVRTLAPETEHALFRAAQEGLTNVRKHAEAKTAVVLLDYSNPAKVLVKITDDGRGAVEGRAGGVGLAGIHERIAALGGRVVAEKPPGGGFRLHVEVPA